MGYLGNPLETAYDGNKIYNETIAVQNVLVLMYSAV